MQPASFSYCYSLPSSLLQTPEGTRRVVQLRAVDDQLAREALPAAQLGVGLRELRIERRLAAEHGRERRARVVRSHIDARGRLLIEGPVPCASGASFGRR